MKKKLTVFFILFALVGCSNNESKSDIGSAKDKTEKVLAQNRMVINDAKQVALNYATTYISAGRKKSDVHIELKVKDKKICGVGECAIAWVSISNAKIPLVMQFISDNWYIDGIGIDEKGHTVFPIPKAVVSRIVEKDSIKLGEMNLPMEIYKMDDNSDGKRTILFCDPGINYCNDALRTISQVNSVHLFFIPVGITPWANEVSALVLSSPIKMRKDVFFALSDSKDVAGDMLTSFLNKKMGITIAKSLLKRSREAVKKASDGARSYGVTKAPVIVTSSGDILMGAVKKDVLIRYLNRGAQFDASLDIPHGVNSRVTGKVATEKAALDSLPGMPLSHGKPSLKGVE